MRKDTPSLTGTESDLKLLAEASNRCPPGLIALGTVMVLSFWNWPCAGAAKARDAAGQSRTVQVPVVDAHDIRFARLSTDDGLSESVVDHVTQDNQGFLWFGTLNGLNRYDGYEFRVRKRGAPNAQLGGTTITALFKDLAGRLWIGADECLDRFDPVTETVTEYRHDPKRPATLAGTVHGITQDRDGQIWVATSNGLDRYNAASDSFTHFQHDDADPTTLDAKGFRREIRFAGVDDSNLLWVETTAGINSFNPRTGKATRFPQLLNKDEYQVQQVYQDRSRKLWIHSREGSGVGTFDPAAREFISYHFVTHDKGTPSAERVTAILEDRAGHLWLGTGGSGLLRLDRTNSTALRYRNDPADPHSLSNNFVLSLYEDREGNIWAGTGGGGVNRFRAIPSGFIAYRKRVGDRNTLDQNFVLSVFRDSHDVLWIGNDGVLNRISPQGAFTLYRNSRGAANSISDGTVLSTIEDRAGKLWFATYRGGLNSFDPGTGAFTAYRHQPNNPESPASDAVIRLVIDPEGSIWVATDHALDQFDPRSKHWKHVPELNEVLGIRHVTTLARDHQGVLWLGTAEAGLVRFDPAARHFDVYDAGPESAAKLSSNRINAVFQGSGPFLWVGTQLGLDRLDSHTQQVHPYSEQDGLPSNAVQGILEDQRGELWISTDNGLARFSPATGAVRKYYESDGLAGNEFNSWGVPFQDSRGEMFFTGVNGVTAFYPERIADNLYVPPVVLTDFRLFGARVTVSGHSPLDRSIAATQELTLSASQNVFSFDFSSLSYMDPERNAYRHMLESLEHQWNYTDSRRRSATYTTLAPGTYVLRVQGSNNHGVWNESGVAIRIRILPPWWGTWSFRAVCATIVLAIMGMAYRFRVRQFQREFKAASEASLNERMRIARELHDTLLQSFHGLLLRFQAAVNLLPGRGADARQVLEAAVDDAAKAITEARDAVQGMRSSTELTNELSKAVEVLGNSLAEQQRAANGDAPAFSVEVEGASRDLHPILRDEVYRMTGEAMRNAFRHARARRIEVEIRYDARELRVRVRDDGIGIDASVLQEGRAGHYGLPGMRERAKSIGGQLDVWSEHGAGTELELTVPAKVAYGGRGGRRFRLFTRKAGTNS